MTTKSVLPSFRVDIQAGRKCFTLILKDFLLCIEPNSKIQIIVSGFCLDVPNNKTLVAVQLFLADKEESPIVDHGAFPIKHQGTKGNLLKQAVGVVPRSRASLNYNKRREHAAFGLSSDKEVEKKGDQYLCCPGSISRLQIARDTPK